MERTEARVVLARVTQFDTGLGDEVYDIYLGFDFVYCGHILDGGKRRRKVNKAIIDDKEIGAILLHGFIISHHRDVMEECSNL